MKKSDWLTVLITVTGIALLVWGAFSGQARSIMNSAIRICLECIGIG